MNNPGNYDCLLFDLDGTLYLDGEPIGDIITRLNQYLARVDGFGVALTNNSSHSCEFYKKRLSRLGLDMSRIEILSPLVTGVAYLKSRNLNKGYMLGTSEAVSELQQAGISHTTFDPEFVVSMFDTELTYAKAQEACHFIQLGIPFFQANIDSFCPTRAGPIPDCGAITDLLIRTTGISPLTHFGKPGDIYASYIKEHIAVRARKMLLVGDRLTTDIALGIRMGIDTLWVRSGDLSPAPEIIPTYQAPTFSTFLNT